MVTPACTASASSLATLLCDMRKFVSEPTSAGNEDAVSCELAIKEHVSILAFLRIQRICGRVSHQDNDNDNNDPIIAAYCDSRRSKAV